MDWDRVAAERVEDEDVVAGDCLAGARPLPLAKTGRGI